MSEHITALSGLGRPSPSQAVHREECTQCFDNQNSTEGIDVCLSCFNGGCLSEDRHHARTHVQRTDHNYTLNIKRRLKPAAKRNNDGQPPAKMTKLSIAEDRDEDRYDHFTFLRYWGDDPVNGVQIEAPEQLARVTTAVLASLSSARQSEVKAWEEEINPCDHTLTLEQLPGVTVGTKCSQCSLTSNLWLCLTCGSLGCGRSQFGVANSGNGHALEHYKNNPEHAAAIKLGTITAEGKGDIYCYACDDAVLDLYLEDHLRTFGIDVSQSRKTEATMTELQIEHNLKYDFSLTSEDGNALEPVFGPGFTGLKNLGNSCYMASVLQTLFSLSNFAERYTQPDEHAAICSYPLPADCVECQMRKVADGLLSGRYSHPEHRNTSSPAIGSPVDTNKGTAPVFQGGLPPTGFKALVGKGHAEFSTMKQQDSEEFWAYLVEVLRRDFKKSGISGENDPTRVFAFTTEQRLQCGVCKKVRYRKDGMDVISVAVPANPVSGDIVMGDATKGMKTGEDGSKTGYQPIRLLECVDSAMLGTETVADYACPECKRGVAALKQTKFASFPDVLVVHAKKFQLVNWVPAKLDIPVILPPNDVLEFNDRYLGRGLQDGEEELPSGDDTADALPVFNEAAMAQLEGMGFPKIRCQKALLATGNNDPETAMEWLFAHMEDANIDDPIQPTTASAPSGPEPTTDQIAMLADMGFTSAQAKKALRETSGNAERAVEWLFNHPDDSGEEMPTSAPAAVASTVAAGSTTVPAKYKLKAFISHKGPSVHSGHYVAHIKQADGQWVLFNDEKVVKADTESVDGLKKLAYLYVFEKA